METKPGRSLVGRGYLCSGIDEEASEMATWKANFMMLGLGNQKVRGHLMVGQRNLTRPEVFLKKNRIGA